MSVAFIGATANNMYLMAAAARSEGIDAVYVHNIEDVFPVSQPSWQHVRALLSPEEAAQIDRPAVVGYEKDWGWQTPDWVIVPSEDVPFHPEGLRGSEALKVKAMSRNHPWWGSALETLKGSDLVVACGTQAAVLAWSSGSPFLVWPHGADARLVAGVEGVQGSVLQRGRTAAARFILRAAFRSATAVATQDPKLLGGSSDLSDRMGARKIVRLPWPAQFRDNPGANSGPAELARFLTTDQPLLVVPSRVDFGVKGHDLLLEGFARLPKGTAHMLVTGWGKDLLPAKELVDTLGITSRVTFLPYLLSKPILYELLAAATVVADQFRISTYGAAAVEAMGLGCPLLMNIDTSAYESKGWVPPPVLQATTADEITDQLARLFEDRDAITEARASSLRWARENHSPKIVADVVRDVGHLGPKES